VVAPDLRLGLRVDIIGLLRRRTSFQLAGDATSVRGLAGSGPFGIKTQLPQEERETSSHSHHGREWQNHPGDDHPGNGSGVDAMINPSGGELDAHIALVDEKPRRLIRGELRRKGIVD
jgi:hypothetical protein